ncbi:DNA polymerase Y family protein [Arsukibacterium sp.]|uniref:Y-family DNA polymerase n=1 Tax=Arsukibacterium sp. TaxID=1977258 RepID=UPI00299D1E29|nr:DNA polymerase Y family protein [Arsukibacterium sp.]MDX1677704.1 DNA polymerase Y family protein [Arsukibacterium sp.]
MFLYLHFPALQLDHLLLSAASSNLPVALVDQQHQLVQLNCAATEAGLKPQMGLASAAALCPDLQLLPYQPEQQTRVLHIVAQQLYQLSSDIAEDQPSGLILRLDGMLKLYGGLEPYWQALRKKLDKLTYRYQYSCGATPYAAKCLANQQASLMTIDPSQLLPALKASPLCATELSDDMQQQMARLGIDTLGQLQALPPAELARRFDSQLLSYLGRLRGDYYHALKYLQPEPGFSRYLELLFDISDSSVLAKPLVKLLQQLELQLSRANCQCYQLLLSLFFRDNPPLQLSIGSAQGEYKADAWLQLCQLQLQNLPLPEPVYGLQLDVKHFASQQSVTETLFARHQVRMSPLQLISLLQARLGQPAVSSLTLENHHLPEQASQRSPPLAGEQPAQPVFSLRPAFLLSRPQPLTEAVTVLQGPERLCPDGFQLSTQRDYFIGRNQQGQWLWLFRTVSQQWYVHGWFS